MKKVFMSIAAMAMAAVMASCGGNANNEQKCNESCDSTAKCEQKCDSTAKCEQKAECAESTATATDVADLTKKYICPNRCESSDEAGACSQCSMDLIENN